MDLTKINIMSRGVEVDGIFCKQHRIKYIYNKIESIEVLGMSDSEITGVVSGSIAAGLKEIANNTGSSMLVEGGLKEVDGGHVVITTIFHFADEYSMNMFVMKYPHGVWDHMRGLYMLKN